MSDDHHYPLAYRIDPHANLTKEELRARGLGGADAIVIASILFPEDGSRSQRILSLDGRTGEPLPPIEIWKTWASMARGLADSEELQPAFRHLCECVHTTVRGNVLGLYTTGERDARQDIIELLRAQLQLLEAKGPQ